MLTRKTVLLAKIESPYGSAGAMVASDAVLISNLDIDIDPTLLDRDVYRDTISSIGSTVGKKIMTCSFDVELKGSGIVPSIASPIEQDAILRACGLITSDQSGLVYTPTSDETLMDSVSLKFNLDGQQYLMTGCYGNLSMNLVAGAFGVLTFTFTGLYTTPTDVSQPATTYINQTQPPIIENLTFLIDTYAGIAENLTLDFNNEVSERPDLNSPNGLKGLRITNRAPSGQVDPEMVPVATKDFFTIFEASTKVAITATIGSVVGNKFDISMPTIQITDITPGDRNGLRIFSIDYLATGDDDEFELKAY